MKRARLYIVSGKLLINMIWEKEKYKYRLNIKFKIYQSIISDTATRAGFISEEDIL
jgi:hypothetical protein